MSVFFPPPLLLGSRVWTWGYKDHGPMDGPKIDIAPNMGGTIVAVEPAYFTMDIPLYTVKWDNGQVSKHYAKELCCIGRFQDWRDFDAAVKAIEVRPPVELTIGPMGGFRQVRLTLTYDGTTDEVVIVDRDVWKDTLEPLVLQQNIPVTTIKLERKKPPSKRRGNWRC